MKKETLSNTGNIERLKSELTEFYEEPDFLQCTNMGEIVEMSLEMLFRKPNLYKDY